MAGKDSQEEVDDAPEDRAATAPSQEAGRTQRIPPDPRESDSEAPGDVLSMSPADIVNEAFSPAGQPVDGRAADIETLGPKTLGFDAHEPQTFQLDAATEIPEGIGEILHPEEIVELDAGPGAGPDGQVETLAANDRDPAHKIEPWDLHAPHAIEDPEVSLQSEVIVPETPTLPTATDFPIDGSSTQAPVHDIDATHVDKPAPDAPRPMDRDRLATWGGERSFSYEEKPFAPEPALMEAAAVPVAAATTSTEAQRVAREGRGQKTLTLFKTGARYAAIGAAGYLAFVVLQILAYRIIDPPGSTLMLMRLLSGTLVERTWVPIERISPNLVRAVIVSEDGRFCDHWGIDVEAMREAIRRSGDSTPRGASTISMQVTKNLFLWPSKSYLRKIIELPLTALIELVWPKRRILEIYLNIAEWGPGIFGAEAAAQYHFRKPASRLGEREAALLAASLPNPVRRDAGDPGPATSRKARVIQARMHMSGPVAACVTGKR